MGKLSQRLWRVSVAVIVSAATMLGMGVLSSQAVQAQTQTHSETSQQQSAATASTAAFTTRAAASTSGISAPSDVMVIAFQQTWDSIASECTNVYGPEGVKYVEVSPPQESIKGTQWWTSYQPVSYKLDSKLGTEAQFKTMVQTCKTAGVGIVADAVLNHTTGSGSGAQSGVAGTQYNNQTGDYPGFGARGFSLAKGDFHACTASISDYTNADNVQQCRLSGMFDLDSSSDYVQDTQADYLAKLYSIGVAGFRIDAAKHIATADLAAIKTKMAAKVGVSADNIWWIQETIGSANEAASIQPSQYLANGDVNEFSFAYQLNQRFKGTIAGLKNITSGLIQSNKASVFVTNWDTERGQSTLTYKDGARYALANAFMLGYGYGQPSIMSGYAFSNTDDGVAGSTDTKVPDVAMNTACSAATRVWNCEQRWTSTRGMIGFHNAVGSAEVTNWTDDGANLIGFGRGNKGYLAINNNAEAKTVSYQTSMPAGKYCNVYAVEDCSQTITVNEDGSFTASIPAKSAIAIYVGGESSKWPAGNPTTDPSDPEYGNETTTNGPTDTSLTIYYKADASWNQVYVQHGIGNDWTQVPGDAMKSVGDGWYELTINTAGTGQEFVFTDGQGNWDNPSGGGNYSAAAGTIQIAVNGKKVSQGNPLPQEYAPVTAMRIHFKPTTATAANTGVYVWGTDTDGTSSQKWYAFNGEDGYGKLFEHSFEGAYDALNFIVTTEDWNKVGTDRSVNAASGTAEAWVDATAPDTTIDAQAAAASSSVSIPAVSLKKPAKLNVTVHYLRTDNNYYNPDDATVDSKYWDVWQWSENANGASAKFTSHDEYGAVAQYTLTNSSGTEKPQFLIRYGGDAWADKDVSTERVIPQSAIQITDKAANEGKAEIWLMQGDTAVYTNPSVIQRSAALRSAEISGMNQISAKISGSQITAAQLKDKVTVDGSAVPAYAEGMDAPYFTVKDNAMTIVTAGNLDVTHAYAVAIDGFGSVKAAAGSVVRTAAFDKAYAYSGDDLGASWHNNYTEFKLWAPTAQMVVLRTFASDQSNDAALASSIDMVRSDKGVWTAKVNRDMADVAYDYQLSFADGSVHESPDPYATAAVQNGERSVVLSDSEMSIPDFNRMPAFTGGNTNAVIAETHIRDFTKSSTSGVSASKRGTYLGMIETGTTNKAGDATGIDYVKKLGITHVQLQPFFDYASVDESKALDDSNYNWGYDPMNYNVPEGSYASSSRDPKTRVKEAKSMVQGIHKQGLRVIMDVVYNHVFDASKQSLGLTVPGYYFRYDANASLVNNSGVGNDTASERAMMRKYIVDSVSYWAKNYKVDGFRFDLMGLHDIATMKAVRAALDKIDPSIIVLGEGWNMNNTLPASDMTTQPNACALDNTGSHGTSTGSTVSFFNDSIRDTLKGSVFSSADTGFVSGKSGLEDILVHNMLGCQYSKTNGDDLGKVCNNGSAEANYANASQVIQYAEIHDNLTLYDKLKASMPNDDEQTTIKRAELADAAVFLAQGVPEIQLGQEFLRTKGGNDNSYNSGDSVNEIDWNRSTTYASSVAYVKGLISLRHKTAALRMSDYGDIDAHSSVLMKADGVVAYELKDSQGSHVIVLNSNTKDVQVPAIAAGSYAVVVADGKSDISSAKVLKLIQGQKLTVHALSATVLSSVNDDQPGGNNDNGGGSGHHNPNANGSSSAHANQNAGETGKNNGQSQKQLRKQSLATRDNDGGARLSTTGISILAVIACAVVAGAGAVGIALYRKGIDADSSSYSGGMSND